MQEKALKCIISYTTTRVFVVIIVNKKNYVEKRQLREQEKTNGILRAKQLISVAIKLLF